MLTAEIRGEAVATIVDSRHSITPDYKEMARISVGNPTATLVEIDQMLDHEDELVKEDNEHVLNADVDLLVKLPAPLPVPPFIVPDVEE